MDRNAFWCQQFAQGLDGADDVGALSLLARQCGIWADLALAEYDKRFSKGAVSKGPALVKPFAMRADKVNESDPACQFCGGKDGNHFPLCWVAYSGQQ